MLTIDDFSYAFINDDVEYVDTYNIEKYTHWKIVKEIYKHNNNYYMLTYHQYPNELIETIILDREYELNLVVKTEKMKVVIDWEIIE